jgi:hypothetical protein
MGEIQASASEVRTGNVDRSFAADELHAAGPSNATIAALASPVLNWRHWPETVVRHRCAKPKFDG